jgi:hypothetical protein
MRKADRLAWTIARYASRIPGGTLFAASGSAAAGIRLAQEMFGSTLRLWGHGNAYDPRGILAVHARYRLLNRHSRAHIGLSAVFDTLGEPHALMATPAQVDGEANANLSAIGDHGKPIVAFGGSRGLPDAGAVHFVLPTHYPRQLVAKVDFVSTAVGSRAEAAMLFTELCVMVWAVETKRWCLIGIAPETSLAEVEGRTGFTFDVAAGLDRLDDPPDRARLLLERIDPLGVRDLDFVSGRREQLDALERLFQAELRLIAENGDAEPRSALAVPR